MVCLQDQTSLLPTRHLPRRFCRRFCCAHVAAGRPLCPALFNCYRGPRRSPAPSHFQTTDCPWFLLPLGHCLLPPHTKCFSTGGKAHSASRLQGPFRTPFPPALL